MAFNLCTSVINGYWEQFSRSLLKRDHGNVNFGVERMLPRLPCRCCFEKRASVSRTYKEMEFYCYVSVIKRCPEQSTRSLLKRDPNNVSFGAERMLVRFTVAGNARGFEKRESARRKYKGITFYLFTAVC